jgi:neutral ceramidase
MDAAALNQLIAGGETLAIEFRGDPPLRRTFHVPPLLLLLALSLPADAATFRAGAARSCITPQLGITLNGGVGPGTARHIHDDLFVRALVLDDGSTRLALAVVDTCLVDRPVFDEAKQLVQQHTGLPPTQVMMSATHTHSAGAVCGVHLSEPDPAYRAWLPGRIADAVRCAVNNLAPAEIAWGSGSLPQHVFCRRLQVKPGVTYANQLGFTNELAKMNWDSPHPADGEPTGPTDPEVFALAVRHADGRPLALLANYSLHYVGDTGLGDISADYFGVFADRIQQLLDADRQDPPFVAMLSNGTSGDINNINPKVKRESQPPYTQIRRVAEDLAQEVLRVTKGLEYLREVTLRAAERECVVATRRPSAAEVAEARAIVAGRPVEKLEGWTDNVAREQLLLAEWPAEVSMPLQVFRIGDLAVAAWPGEIFASSGLELKRRSPVRPLFNVGLANGWYGYIPPPEQFPFGAYETWRMRTSPLETNAIPKMLDGFLGLIEASREGATDRGEPSVQDHTPQP